MHVGLFGVLMIVMGGTGQVRDLPSFPTAIAWPRNVEVWIQTKDDFMTAKREPNFARNPNTFRMGNVYIYIYVYTYAICLPRLVKYSEVELDCAGCML